MSRRDRGRSRPRDPAAEAREAEALAELRAVYAEVDARTAGATCDLSTDCCRFRVTGREPYPTAVELLGVRRALAARGGLPTRRSLPVADDGRCPLLDDAGRCAVYAARPFGCRTFFCARASLPEPLDRRAILALGRRLAAASERLAPGTGGAVPLSSAIVPAPRGRTRR